MTHQAPQDAPAGALGHEICSKMGQITRDRIQHMALENANHNLPVIRKGQSIQELRNLSFGKSDEAIIVAAGPSIKRTRVAERIQQARYGGAIIATESAMLYCLRNGIIPDLVVTLDPHPKRIARWFGDPDLNEAKLEEDDYFARQDLDSSFADQLRVNDEIMSLLDRYGKQIRIAVSSSASAAVVKRASDTGMEIFWWNPMLDDPDEAGSVTRALFHSNGLPCVNAGGNVGSAAWMMADAVLGKSRVALTGMDFAYYRETPYKNTQYYPEAVSLVGAERLDEIYIHIYNPFLKQWFYTDPAYLWYRECFLDMAMEGGCQTFNCTGGGILFGDKVEFTNLDVFLKTGRS